VTQGTQKFGVIVQVLLTPSARTEFDVSRRAFPQDERLSEKHFRLILIVRAALCRLADYAA
jgi:hypothetical protein